MQQIYATVALQSWANVANINIVKVATETSSAVGDIRIAFTTDGLMGINDFAYAYTPGQSYGGDVWLNTIQPVVTGNDFNVGGFGYQTLVHELGHALGLAHPFEAAIPLSTSLDNFKYTQMSYSDSPGHQDGGYSSYYPSTPMLLDIQAIQYLYGANMSYNAGNDTYVFNGTSINYETIWDAGGIDTLVYNSTTGGVINLNAGTFSVLGRPVSLDNGTLQYDNVAIAYNVTIENATGGNGNDSLIGNDVGNSLVGSNGLDNLTGNAGNDTLDGGAGNDTLNGGDGNDTYNIDVNTDVIQADTSGIDTVNVNYATGTYTLAADLEHITLFGTGNIGGTGNALNNVITGNTGNNIVDGGTGSDLLWGDAGNDTLIGGEGNDTAKYSGVWSDYNLSYNAGVITVQDLNAANGNEGADTLRQIETMQFTNINIGLVNGLKYIASHSDLINAFGTNADAAIAHYIEYGASEGRTASFDSDFYIAKYADLRAAFGADTNAATMHYIQYGASEGRALLTSGDDLLTGSASADTLHGYAGNDTLTGDTGNDTLVGGAGNDILSGGLGQDIFDFNAVIESLLGVTRDIITDFSHAQLDKIDLSAIDANSMLLNDQAFLSAILTGGAFTSAGQLRLQGNVLSGNTDNDFNTSEFEIQLTGIDTLTSIDFFL